MNLHSEMIKSYEDVSGYLFLLNSDAKHQNIAKKPLFFGVFRFNLTLKTDTEI